MCIANHYTDPPKLKESLFYLTTPLEHIDSLYHQLLGVKHMVIVTYSFRGNPLSLHRLLFPISSNGSFICTFPQAGQHITPAFDGPFVDHCLEQKITQTAHVSTMQDRSAMQEDPNLYSRVLYHLSFVLPFRDYPDVCRILGECYKTILNQRYWFQLG